MKLGVILDGKLKDKKIILEPRKGLDKKTYLVEKGIFMNGSPEFSKACLICEEFIPENHKCNNHLGGE